MRKEILYSNVKQLIEQAKNTVVQNVNTILVFTNYYIGKMIIENEQQGKERARYAEKTLKNLSRKLTKDFGEGYSSRNLRAFRQFYLQYPDRDIWQTVSAKSESIKIISKRNVNVPEGKQVTQKKENAEVIKWQTVSAKFQSYFPLSWSHYSTLLKINTKEERNFYEIESEQNNWSVRELQRQYSSSLYERIILSKDKKTVKKLSKKGQIITKPTDILKEPYILEFLDLKEEVEYTESQFETAIIKKLENFLLELGKGFLFKAGNIEYHLMVRAFISIWFFTTEYLSALY